MLRYTSTLATAVTAYPANSGIENEPTSNYTSGTFFPSGGAKKIIIIIIIIIITTTFMIHMGGRGGLEDLDYYCY